MLVTFRSNTTSQRTRLKTIENIHNYYAQFSYIASAYQLLSEKLWSASYKLSVQCQSFLYQLI
jgi:hypothetical protein